MAEAAAHPADEGLGEVEDALGRVGGSGWERHSQLVPHPMRGPDELSTDVLVIRQHLIGEPRHRHRLQEIATAHHCAHSAHSRV